MTEAGTEIALRAAAGRAGNVAVVSPAPMPWGGILWQYFLLSWLALLVNASRYLWEVPQWGAWTIAFLAAAGLAYCAAFLLPAQILALAWGRLVYWHRLNGLVAGRPTRRFLLAAAPAAVGFALVQVFTYADVFMYGHWARHIDSFVWNLLTTPGGFASMDIGPSGLVSFALVIGVLAGVQGLLLVAVLKLRTLRRILASVLSRRGRLALAGGLILLAAFQAVTYGVCKLRWYRPVLRAAEVLPGYLPISFSKLGRKMGWEAPRAEAAVDVQLAGSDLRYPLRPLTRSAAAKRYNIVWLAVESWRADVVDPETQPLTHAFARQSVWFRRHYSGGNDTRMGMFAMFYGLYGSYWFPMLETHRSAVLIDLMQGDGYQFGLYTSQSFTYPEFDRTIFANIPRECMHAISDGMRACERDRRNVDALLDFLDRRDPNRPFLTYMFFETTHARYDFRPEDVIRRPFLEDLNYATLKPADAPLLRNRYLNSAHSLDRQIGRVLDYLRQHALLDSTIVVLTGDHGEELMENGHWGHSSEVFRQGDALTPLILHAPGQAPREVLGMTSHLDIAPTVLRLLGVTNPPEDYCLGADLLDGPPRDHVVMAGWGTMAYIDRDCKIIFPFRGGGLHEVRRFEDGPVPDDWADELLRAKLPRRAQLLRDMKRFRH